MGVKIRFLKGAWWVVIHQHGRRKMKRVGDRETADRVARAIRERLAHGDLHLTPAATDHTLKTYATSWLAMMQATLKASTVTFYQGISPSTFSRRWDRSRSPRSGGRTAASWCSPVAVRGCRWPRSVALSAR